MIPRSSEVLTFGLPQNILQKLFDFLVLGHQHSDSILLNRIEGLCWVDAALKQDRIDAEI